MQLTQYDKDFLRGYAAALQGMMFMLTGENSCAKSYDPVDFDDNYIHSYAFDLKDGGRHHPISDYNTLDEILKIMLDEAVDWCKND